MIDGGDGFTSDHADWLEPVLTETARIDAPAKSRVAVALADLGFTGEVKVRDLWQREDLGVFRGEFRADIPLHGAGLYRLTPE